MLNCKILQSQSWKFMPEKWKLSMWKFSHRNLYTSLFLINKNWKQPKCPLTCDWINKLWYVHIIKYCSGVKRNELFIMIQTTTWMDLEGIMLSEKCQSQKVTYDVIPFIWYSWCYKIIVIKSPLVVARD